MFNFFKSKQSKEEETPQVSLEELMQLPILEVLEKADAALSALNANPNKSNYQVVKVTCDAVVKKIDELPLAKRGNLSGIKSVIGSSMGSLEQLISYGKMGASGVSQIITSIQTSIAFAAGQLA